MLRSASRLGVLLMVVATAACTKDRRFRADGPPDEGARIETGAPGRKPADRAPQPRDGTLPPLRVKVMVYFVHHDHIPDVMDLEVELPKEYTDGGKHFSDAIVSIKAVGPRGPLPVTKASFVCEEAVVGGAVRSCEYRTQKGPFPGTYTVTLTTRDGQQVTASDHYPEKRVIPVPEVISPRNDEVVAERSPTFRWKATKYRDIPLYYSLDVYEKNPPAPGALPPRVYKSPAWKRDMLSDRVPAGILKPNTVYMIRIRVADGARWPRQNQSYTDWRVFRTAASLN